METIFFQIQILDDIKQSLKSGNVPVKQLSEIARKALVLSDKYPKSIPHQAIIDFLEANPKIGKKLKTLILQEDNKKNSYTLREVRKNIDK